MFSNLGVNSMLLSACRSRFCQVSITNSNKVCLEFVRRSLGLTSSASSLVSTSTTASARSGEEVSEIVQISSNGMNVSEITCITLHSHILHVQEHW